MQMLSIIYYLHLCCLLTLYFTILTFNDPEKKPFVNIMGKGENAGKWHLLLFQQKHVRKVVGGFGKKSCVSTVVRKPDNTCASPTAMI